MQAPDAHLLDTSALDIEGAFRARFGPDGAITALGPKRLQLRQRLAPGAICGYIPSRPGRHNHDVVTRAGRGRE